MHLATKSSASVDAADIMEDFKGKGPPSAGATFATISMLHRLRGRKSWSHKMLK